MHSLDSADFADRDATGARTFGRAARDARTSSASFTSVGSARPVTASLSICAAGKRSRSCWVKPGCRSPPSGPGIIIGNGGLSWELMRELVAHLPVMVTPRWVRTKAQPVAIADVVRYLTAVLELPETAGRRVRNRRAGDHDV